MNLYYTKYVCGECGADIHVDEGAHICPYCGGELYKARSGRKKTVAACRTAAKIFAAIAMPSLLAAIVLGSAGLFWFAVTVFVTAMGALTNATREERKRG